MRHFSTNSGVTGKLIERATHSTQDILSIHVHVLPQSNMYYERLLELELEVRTGRSDFARLYLGYVLETRYCTRIFFEGKGPLDEKQERNVPDL